jgi:hypothetical protein
MRFRPANIRLINRRSNLPPTAAGPVLEQRQKQQRRQNNPMGAQELTGSLHIRALSGLILRTGIVCQIDRALQNGGEAT